MTDAPQEDRGTARREAPRPPTGRFRWMVDFWVWLLIGIGVRCPGLARVLRPLAVRITWWSSPNIRRGTGENAAWLIGPDPSPAHRRAFGLEVIGSFFDFLLDLGRCCGRTVEQIASEIEGVEGLDEYRRARQARRGAIVVTAHLGSFEIGVAGIRLGEPRVHIVFRPDRLGAFESMRARLRKTLGVVEASVDEGWPVWIRLRDALIADEVVMMQGDRVLEGQRGMDVPFFGGRLCVPTGPARLALASGAPLIPVFSIRTPRGRIRIVMDRAITVIGGDDPGAAVERATRELTLAIERQVARQPGQWLVLHSVLRGDQPELEPAPALPLESATARWAATPE